MARLGPGTAPARPGPGAARPPARAPGRDRAERSGGVTHPAQASCTEPCRCPVLGGQFGKGGGRFPTGAAPPRPAPGASRPRGEAGAVRIPPLPALVPGCARPRSPSEQQPVTVPEGLVLCLHSTHTSLPAAGVQLARSPEDVCPGKCWPGDVCPRNVCPGTVWPQGCSHSPWLCRERCCSHSPLAQALLYLHSPCAADCAPCGGL